MQFFVLKRLKINYKRKDAGNRAEKRKTYSENVCRKNPDWTNRLSREREKERDRKIAEERKREREREKGSDRGGGERENGIDIV